MKCQKSSRIDVIQDMLQMQTTSFSLRRYPSKALSRVPRPHALLEGFLRDPPQLRHHGQLDVVHLFKTGPHHATLEHLMRKLMVCSFGFEIYLFFRHQSRNFSGTVHSIVYVFILFRVFSQEFSSISLLHKKNPKKVAFHKCSHTWIFVVKFVVKACRLLFMFIF